MSASLPGRVAAGRAFALLSSGILLAGVMVAAGCTPDAPVPDVPADEAPIRPARIVTVAIPGADAERRFVARVAARQTVDLSFEVPGQIVALPVREGALVESGALIAELERSDFERELREAEVQFALARQDLERKRGLFAQEAVSEADVDEAEARHALRAVELERAREDLADTRLHAPFDAWISRRWVDNHVNVTAGQDIVRVQDLSELDIVASLPEALLATVTRDRVAAVDVRFPFAPERAFDASYREHANEADDVAQTYEVTFSMPRPADLNVLPGMTAEVGIRFVADDVAGAGAITLPLSALVGGADGGFHVWVRDPASGAVRRRGVAVESVGDGTARIATGLAPGEQVVAAGVRALQEGMRVRPLESDRPR